MHYFETTPTSLFQELQHGNLSMSTGGRGVVWCDEGDKDRFPGFASGFEIESHRIEIMIQKSKDVANWTIGNGPQNRALYKPWYGFATSTMGRVEKMVQISLGFLYGFGEGIRNKLWDIHLCGGESDANMTLSCHYRGKAGVRTGCVSRVKRRAYCLQGT